MLQVIMLCLAVLCGTVAELTISFAPSAEVAYWTLILAAILCALESLRAPTIKHIE